MIFSNNRFLLLLSISFLFFLSLKVQSQTWSDNLLKYWFYRDRLEYFVMPGTEAGQSMVADIRNQPWQAHQDKIGFGQQHTRMGFYLGMLATEYKLLQDNGQYQELAAILYEIELALNALIRTDMHESGPPWSYLGITEDYLDGFFVREDVPPLFNAQYNAEDYLLHFNKNLSDNNIVFLLQHGYFGKPAKVTYNKIDCINAIFNEPASKYFKNESAFTDVDYNNILIGNISNNNPWLTNYKTQNFNSHDEVIGVLIGLALVYKLVDEPSIRQTTSEIADRFTRYMWQHPRCGGNEAWMSFFPDCTPIGQSNGGIHFSYAIALNKSRLLFNLSILPMSEGIDLYYEILWGGAIISAINYPDVSHKLMTTQLLCLSDYAPLGQARLSIQEISWLEDWDTFYLLVYSILHDKNPNIFYDHSKLHNQLNIAPCGGTYSYSNYNGCPVSGIDYPGVPGWSSENKFTHAFFEQILGQFYFPGTYHGLDYMLLYNLASISFPTQFPPFINLKNRNISGNFPLYIPFPSMEIGSHSSPLTIRAIHSIQCTSVINDQGNVTLIAGESIDLLPGFDAQNGCEFEAKIESYNCNGLPYKNMNVPAWDNENLYSKYDSILGIPNENRQQPMYVAENYFKENIFDPDILQLNYFPEPEQNQSFFVHCYPNPACDFVNMEIQTPEVGILKLELYDAQGILIKELPEETIHEGITTKTISTNNLNSGSYFLKIHFNNSFYTWSFVR